MNAITVLKAGPDNMAERYTADELDTMFREITADAILQIAAIKKVTHNSLKVLHLALTIKENEVTA